ncbi:efflux RND transporter permease subunit [Fuerstiella marisgermanici]|uniref:Multidrug transporter MdtB n=1 Tax=Fuerstiella marisgermanici TaxID=1891926 RepID=A0A1P8WHP7_9PLAN|nr:efflux RND transporter permease subunit [Fuerstiella marisgermanici]APZ93584.1 Multidrug transporter MdtB [Fuerstiella marisgermanici]
MNLAALAMRYRPVVLTFVVLMVGWGAFTFATMPRREDPEFTIRTCVVTTQWTGAPTVKVEELITDKLEESLDGIEEVDHLRSTTTNGLSVIYVDLDDRIPPGDIQNVWDKVRAKVDLVKMPTDNIHPIVNDEFGDTAVLLLGIHQTPLAGDDAIEDAHRYSPRDLELFADRVRDKIRLLDGVAKVEKHGVNDEAIYIETDLGTWSQVGLTSEALKHLVDARNIVSPGGSIDTENGKFNVKPGGEFDAVDEIESIAVAAVQTGDSLNKVRLTDIGLKVTRDYVDPRSVVCRFSDANGSYPAVMLSVTMQSGSNIIDVCDLCMARIDQMVTVDQSLPRDLAVTPVSNQADNVNMKISDVIGNVVSAIVIVVIVVFLFVGLRTSLVMAANIPIVVFGAVGIVGMLGVQLEQISLASIIIALGLLVDNAVQVCDQTRTNCLAGMTPRDAAVEGANTLMFPMLSGTLTTVAAFLPMLFALSGGGAEYIYSLPVTLSTTLLLSWFLAMTVCVVLAAAFIRAPKNPDAPNAPLPWLGYKAAKLTSAMSQKLRKKDAPEVAEKTSDNERAAGPSDNIFLRIYGLTATVALRMKWITVLAAVALLFAVLRLPVSTEFFPQDRRDQFYVNVLLPETATIEQTDQVVHHVEEAIQKLSPITLPDGTKVERLRAMRSMTAQGGARWALGINPPAPSTSVSEILVRTTDGNLTPQFVEDIRKATNDGRSDLGISPIPGARIVPKKLALGPPAAPVELRVIGDGFADVEQLRKTADQVKALIKQQAGTWDIADSWGVDGFQLRIDIDDEKANLAGVTNADVADILTAYFSGLKLSTFREGDHQIPVYFRLEPQQRRSLNGVDAAYVEGENGKLPLNSIAKTITEWQPAKIERRDLNRTINVSAEVEDGVSGNDVVNAVMASDEMQSIIAALPIGYRIEIGGSLEESQDSSAEMLMSFAISLLLIVLILVLQYNGWSKTLIILATLPLAMIGAWFGLWLTNNPLGFMPQLGLLSLFGIVLNTGIIFIEFADILIAEKARQLQAAGTATGPILGLTRTQFRACLSAAGKQRMLPIFLTTATTIGGLIPLALSGGPLWEGMAWLMVYGLIVATLLTLYIVPSLFAIIVETFGISPIEMPEGSDSGGQTEAVA